MRGHLVWECLNTMKTVFDTFEKESLNERKCVVIAVEPQNFCFFAVANGWLLVKHPFLWGKCSK